MSRYHDTIAALATPAGTAAIAILRVSGPDTAVIVQALCGAVPPVRIARHVDYRARGGELLDDVLITFFKGPHSYTGEDTCEVSCHGNPFIAQKILEDLLARGCRPAEAGEFTQRAFLNGKMDLSQAEAVMDLIHARSERALAAANQQLRGGLARRMSVLIDSLLGVIARIEAYIDFPEEDLPEEDRARTREDVFDILLKTNRLIATEHFGQLLREGIKTVIVGAPNAGKSSLLNRLVGTERAIVSAQPGTTRDFIEEPLMVGAHFLRLVDTAGLNPTPEGLERLGIQKTLERIADADLILLTIDATLPSPPELSAVVRDKLTPDRALVVWNKADLPGTNAAARSQTWTGFRQVSVSALTGQGLEELRDAIGEMAETFSQNPDDLIAINARHAHALNQARELLGSVLQKLDRGDATELIASDLRGVLSAFGEISGRIDNEQMLDRLFATFCIGK